MSQERHLTLMDRPQCDNHMPCIYRQKGRCCFATRPNPGECLGFETGFFDEPHAATGSRFSQRVVHSRQELS